LEVGSWKLEVGSWKVEAGSGKLEVGSWKVEVGRKINTFKEVLESSNRLLYITR
jgi:hypothetical protein